MIFPISADLGVMPINDPVQGPDPRDERIRVMERALDRIAHWRSECGCVPCTGDCRNAEALGYAIDGLQEIALAALSLPATTDKGRP